MNPFVILCASMLLVPVTGFSYEKAFKATKPGIVEITRGDPIGELGLFIQQQYQVDSQVRMISFDQFLNIQIDSDNDDISASICCTGMPTGPATDVQNLKAGFNGKPIEIDGDHR